jgi:hypothetical protein
LDDDEDGGGAAAGSTPAKVDEPTAPEVEELDLTNKKKKKTKKEDVKLSDDEREDKQVLANL